MIVLKKCLLRIWGPPGARGPGARAPMAPLLIRHWWEGDFTKTAKDLHRQQYTDANGTIVAYIHAGSARPTWAYHSSYIRIAVKLMKACNDENLACHDEDLDVIKKIAICNTWNSTKNKFASNYSCWALISMLWQQMERWRSFTWKSNSCCVGWRAASSKSYWWCRYL